MEVLIATSRCNWGRSRDRIYAWAPRPSSRLTSKRPIFAHCLSHPPRPAAAGSPLPRRSWRSARSAPGQFRRSPPRRCRPRNSFPSTGQARRRLRSRRRKARNPAPGGPLRGPPGVLLVGRFGKRPGPRIPGRQNRPALHSIVGQPRRKVKGGCTGAQFLHPAGEKTPGRWWPGRRLPVHSLVGIEFHRSDQALGFGHGQRPTSFNCATTPGARFRLADAAARFIELLWYGPGPRRICRIRSSPPPARPTLRPSRSMARVRGNPSAGCSAWLPGWSARPG